MYLKFETVINDLRKKANYKNHILEQKLATFQRDYDKKELDLRELVQRSGLDSSTIEEICKKMEEAIEAKNSILRNLKYSLAHATKAYNDAIRVYEAKLVEFGIPADELGLEPLPTNTSKMPAGLVAAWFVWYQKSRGFYFCLEVFVRCIYTPGQIISITNIF